MKKNTLNHLCDAARGESFGLCSGDGGRKYYEAYDDRYRQVHGAGLQWFDTSASPIVGEVMARWDIRPGTRLLELGCGEGRDAIPLLRQGHDLLATDIAPAAIAYCRNR